MLTSREGGEKKKKNRYTHVYVHVSPANNDQSMFFFFFFSLQFLSLSVARFSFVTNVTSNKACESKSMSDFPLDSPRFHALHLENTSRNSLEPILELTVLYIYIYASITITRHKLFASLRILRVLNSFRRVKLENSGELTGCWWTLVFENDEIIGKIRSAWPNVAFPLVNFNFWCPLAGLVFPSGMYSVIFESFTLSNRFKLSNPTGSDG